MSKMEKLGIENLKPIFVWAFNVGEKFEGIAGSVLKKLPMIFLALLGGLKYLNKLVTAWEEFKDLDEAEKAEIHTAVSTEFDLENDIVEAKIEEYFMYVLNVWILISGTVLILKMNK